jgi:hypothetical protein
MHLALALSGSCLLATSVAVGRICRAPVCIPTAERECRHQYTWLHCVVANLCMSIDH